MKELAGLEFKKKFISSFLKNYELKDSDTAKVLKFLLKNEALLKRVYLVNNIHSFPNVMLVSAKDSPAPAFLCYLKGQTWDNIDEAIAILILSPPAEIYLCLAGESKPRLGWECPEWAKKPSRSKVKGMIRSLEKEILKNYFVREKKRLELESKIDYALDSFNQEEFNRLSLEYKNVVEFN